MSIFTDVCSLLAGCVILLCQWCVGSYINQRLIGGKLSPVATWICGLSFLAILNTCFLALGWGALVHLNLLALLFLRKSFFKVNKEFLKPLVCPLLCVASILTISNLFNPPSEWDPLCGYLYYGRFWSEQGSLDPTYLFHSFARRPQIVSVVYSWCFSWGNVKTCQLLDLCFFLAAFVWIGQRFKLSSAKFLSCFLLLYFCTWDRSAFISVAGGGNDWFTCVLMLVCYEIICEQKFQPWVWGTVAICLITSRWTGVPIFVLLVFLSFTARRLTRSQFLRALLLPAFLGCWWHLWLLSFHGNPAYPNLVPSFGGYPGNIIFFHDYGTSEGVTKNFVGLRSLVDLFVYMKHLGPAALVFLLALLIKSSKKEDKLLRRYAWFYLLINAFVTSQWRFQYLVLLVLTASILQRSKIPHKNKRTQIIVRFTLIVLLWFPLKTHLPVAYDVLRDSRQLVSLLNHRHLAPAPHK